ncbi:MAG: HEPN domain-containing protein [Promethearchaeati archaeon SRVP18_Atabeyarchaeia-1]
MISQDKLFAMIAKVLSSPVIKDLYDFIRVRSSDELGLIRSLLDLARQDLESAKLLRANSIYNLAVYHVQQSVEKAAKAWALESLFIDKSELRDVGHLSPLAFSKILDKEIGRKLADVTELVFSGTRGPLVLEDLVTSRSSQFARLPGKEIKRLLDVCTQLSSEVPEVMGKVLPQLTTLLSEVRYPGDEEQSKTLRIFREKSLQRKETDWSYRLIKDMLGGVLLLLLSVITFPHESYTRYPDLEVKPGEYNESMGIVETFDEVCSVIDKAINDFSSSISDNDDEKAKQT